jgi:hypothetical protein
VDGRIIPTEISSDFVGNRTTYLPLYSLVPQPSTLQQLNFHDNESPFFIRLLHVNYMSIFSCNCSWLISCNSQEVGPLVEPFTALRFVPLVSSKVFARFRKPRGLYLSNGCRYLRSLISFFFPSSYLNVYFKILIKTGL